MEARVVKLKEQKTKLKKAHAELKKVRFVVFFCCLLLTIISVGKYKFEGPASGGVRTARCAGIEIWECGKRERHGSAQGLKENVLWIEELFICFLGVC
jgi:hypothetical protein